MNRPSSDANSLNRRAFIAGTSGLMLGSLGAQGVWLPTATAEEEAGVQVFQAMGTRVGEVTDTTAIVWTRCTAVRTRLEGGVKFMGRPKPRMAGDPPEVTVPVEELEGVCPGAPGKVRLRYGRKQDLSDAQITDWVTVTEDGDFIQQFALSGLEPNATYYYESQATGAQASTTTSLIRGQFETAPSAKTPSDFRFCVMTCQGYHDRGHPDGHPIYPAMLALRPKFTCLTGDLVYYDSNAPRAVTARLARYHWERMFSLPRLLEFNRNMATYWLKDDHDTLSDDAWPGMKAGEFTYAEGQEIFRQQAPLADGPCYRTFRWGRDLQIWLTDSRDYRSPNRMPDGPEKTIWGDEQKAWFKRTVQESDATWKILVSPNPLVGPDRPNKNDNHANRGFTHEGDEIRRWLQTHVPNNFFVICGDRHWQYHSVHPETGVQEFSVGPASDEHAGGTPGEDKSIHRFHRVKGGFLSVTLKPNSAKSDIVFRLHDVNGDVVYEYERAAPVGG